MAELTQEDRDLISIAHFRGGIARCPGGRLIPDGYVCIHCGHDTGDGKCGLPQNQKPKAKAAS